MDLMRCNFIFFQQGYGWSLTFFQNNLSANPYADVQAKALTLAQRLQAMIGSNTYINGWRISDEAAFRDVSLRFYGTGNAGLQGTNGQSAPPAVCLLVKHNAAANAAPSAYRPYRGIPVSMVQNGGIFVPSGGWQTAFNTYIAQLAADKWGWLGASIRQQHDIFSIISGGNNQQTITTDMAFAGVPLNTTIQVSISRLKLGASQINGLRKVKFTSPSVLVTNESIPITPYVSGGRVLWSQKTFVEDSGTGGWQRIAERKPGRPYYLSRGRRLARRAA